MPNLDGPDAFITGFLDDYFAECDEHLTAIRRILLSAETGDGRGLPAADLEEAFRSFHSLKGLAGMVGLREAELLAHQMESYLRALRSGATLLTEDGLDALLRGTQLLEDVIAAKRDERALPSIDTTLETLERFAVSAPERQAPAKSSEAGTWRALFTPLVERSARGVNVDTVRTRLAKSARIVNAVPRVSAEGAITFEFTLADVSDPGFAAALEPDGVVVEPIAPPPSSETVADAPRGETRGTGLLSPSHFVRVDLTRLDELMRMIGDLVISRARLADSLAGIEARFPGPDWRQVHENGLAIDRHLRDLREGVMRVRMVPVGEVFRRMGLVVRDLARESGKKVDLQLSGADTEIDKFVIERMMDPVLHLVRNAVAHGIEAPAERLASGKPETARLTLAAASVGDVVTLEVSDDGRGVDREAVARRATQAGTPLPAGTLDSSQLLDIIAAPGFSTRESADRAAGRGVGMSVVETAVKELGGTLTLDTASGEGTRFLIEIPLTLAITDAILATVGAQTFAVPQSSVREVAEVDPSLVRAVEGHEIVPYRGGVLPLVRLANAFGVRAVGRRSLHTFIIGHGSSAVAVAVDKIVGQREIVVRPISDPLLRVDGVTGATDLGNGRVVLILDLARIAAAHTASTGVS